MVDALNATALTGIRVLDLGQIYNGSYATMMMAMAGVDVIKVEPLRGRRCVAVVQPVIQRSLSIFSIRTSAPSPSISRIHEGWLCLSDLSQKQMWCWKTSHPTR